VRLISTLSPPNRAIIFPIMRVLDAMVCLSGTCCRQTYFWHLHFPILCATGLLKHKSLILWSFQTLAFHILSSNAMMLRNTQSQCHLDLRVFNEIKTVLCCTCPSDERTQSQLKGMPSRPGKSWWSVASNLVCCLLSSAKKIKNIQGILFYMQRPKIAICSRNWNC
jgi:hypothetical protein